MCTAGPQDGSILDEFKNQECVCVLMLSDVAICAPGYARMDGLIDGWVGEWSMCGLAAPDAPVLESSHDAVRHKTLPHRSGDWSPCLGGPY